MKLLILGQVMFKQDVGQFVGYVASASQAGSYRVVDHDTASVDLKGAC